jgi:hypothetical protein
VANNNRNSLPPKVHFIDSDFALAMYFNLDKEFTIAKQELYEGKTIKIHRLLDELKQDQE